MHPYTITATPNRRQRLTRWLQVWAPRLAVLAGMALLGLLVVILRIARVVADLAATYAAYVELYVAKKAGKPPLGQAAGVVLAEAFTAEFNRGFAPKTAA